jgi:phosphate-selective porin
MRSRALVMVAALLVAADASAQDVNDAARHPSLRLGAVQLELLARVQLDARFRQRQADTGEDDEARDLDIGRKRVGVRGRVTRVAAFEVEAEVETRNPWRDVYVDYRQFRAIRVRAGRFKVPFSLDYTTSSANLDFIDRSRAADRLSGGRDRGVMAHGRLWDEHLKYEVGAFADDKTMAMRLTARPLGARRSAVGPLAVAAAFTRGTHDERLVESVWVNGHRQRAGLELRWQPGPVTVTAEYMRLTNERRGQGVSGDDLPSLVMTGWYAAGTWAVRPALRSVRPRLELAARIDGLRVGSDGDPGASFSPRAPVVSGHVERALTLGVNWYATRRVKLQFNGVRAHTDTSRALWTPLVRLQVSI